MFSDLIGQSLKEIIGGIDSDELIFITNENKKYKMYHSQNCCESVSIDDIIGNLEDLLNSPILLASEDTSNENPEEIKKEYQDSFTWTFYNIATKKGHVTIRWYGVSNCYYSESVDFKEI